MKKIAFIFPPLLPLPSVRGGATETLIQQLINDNEARGECRFTVFSRYDPEAEKAAEKFRNTQFCYIKEQETLGDKLGFLWFRLRRKLSRNYVPEPYLKSVVKQLEKDQYDAIIVESSLRFIPYIKKETRQKVYLHLHFDAVASKQPNLKQAMSLSDGVICVSRFIEDSIRRYMPDVKTYVLPNVTDAERFDAQRYSAQVNAMKQHFGFTNEPIVIYSGRLIHLKGVSELVQAFKLAQQQIPNLKLVLVGSADYGQTTHDDYYDRLLGEIGDLLNKSVFLTGYVDHSEMPVYYAMADVAVLPTTTVEEAAPLSVLEALSSGCFFVGSDSGAIPELAAKGYASIITRDENYVENMALRLAEAVQGCKRNDDAGITPGRQHVLEHHDSKRYYENFLKLLQKV